MIPQIRSAPYAPRPDSKISLTNLSKQSSWAFRSDILSCHVEYPLVDTSKYFAHFTTGILYVRWWTYRFLVEARKVGACLFEHVDLDRLFGSLQPQRFVLFFMSSKPGFISIRRILQSPAVQHSTWNSRFSCHFSYRFWADITQFDCILFELSIVFSAHIRYDFSFTILRRKISTEVDLDWRPW